MTTATLAAPPAVPTVPAGVAPAPRLLTAADLAVFPTELPSGTVRYELNDGALVVMPPPGDIHGKRQGRVITFLYTDAEDVGLGEARGEVGIVLRRNPDRVVGADAAFILKKSLPVRRAKEGFLETIPEIVVEVRSKNDRLNEIRAKKEEYFDAGVQLVWVFDPDDKTVTAYRQKHQPQVFNHGEMLTTDLLPGFAVPVDRMFAGM